MFNLFFFILKVIEVQLRREKQNFDHYLTLRHKVLSSEKLKLTELEITFSTQIYWLMYPRFNQGKWVSPFVNSQQKLGSVVSSTAQGLQKKKKKKKEGKLQRTQRKPLRIWFRKWNNIRILKMFCNRITKRNTFSQSILFLDWKNNLQQRKSSKREKI